MARKSVLAIVVTIPLLVITCGLYPFFHNRYLHPLGRLAGNISEGDSCRELRESFVAYAAARPAAGFTEPRLTTDLLHTEEVAPATGLFLSDESPFDDVQLTVRCTSSGQVAEILFIGD